MFDGADAEEAGAIPTVFVETFVVTPSRPIVVKPGPEIVPGERAPMGGFCGEPSAVGGT